ncbi:hypothetical protein K440DRAFT_585327 [Wilcoxina mikolae CBS 423.85]|nr:hypothetical protein K440DRAFT_585327 [Wilcoxina mikolae CBS 423.85]
MHRSPFANFRKPHEHLLSISNMIPTSANPFSHSRTRNRSSGGSSVSSQPKTNLLADSDSDENTDPTYSRSRSRGSRSKSRSVSPPWDSVNSTSVPLLPVNSDVDSRTHSPYPPYEDAGNDGMSDWRIGEGGTLGWCLWNTQRGWLVYIVFLVVLYGATSLALLIMNRFILWTGVYKFPYPLTTTLLQLLFTQFFLYASASVTRSFSRSLHAIGLACIIAPKPKPSKGKRRASDTGGLRDFANKLRPRTTGGIFEIRWREARIVLPIAVVYSLKIMLSNLAFAYTQIQIYQVSRVSSLIWALGLTHLFHRSQSLTVTTLSSCITMTLSLIMASLRPGSRFAIEGFVAGLFSTFFVAAYPILLSRTYKAFAQFCSNSSGVFSGDLLGVDGTDGGVLLSGDGKDGTRAAWKLLHYINFLSILFILPCVIISGELQNIGRNCYFLDVAFFWLMMFGAGAAAGATFVSGFLLVSASTPLTMVVTTYPRSALQTVLLIGFKMPTWSWVGVLMCWGSSVWYLVGRRKECGFSSFYGTEESERLRGRRRRGEAEA